MELAIEATRDLRNEVLALEAALDALPLEKTIHIRYDTSGAEGLAGGAFDAASIDAQAEAMRAAADAAYADAAAQTAAAAATDASGDAATRAAKNEYLLAMAERMRANSAGEAKAAQFDQTAATLASIDATLAAAKAQTLYADAMKVVDGTAQDAAGGYSILTNAIKNGMPMWTAGAGRFGFLTGNVQLFGGALTQIGVPAILATASGLHLLVDGILETTATLLPAALAFASFGVAAVPTVQDIVHQMQNLNTVNQALGTNLYPLTGGFTALADAVKPEVYVLFGEGLDRIAAKTGIFSQVAQGAGKVVDDLGARFVYAITSGNTFSGFMHNAVADLAGWGNLIGNVGGIIGNVFSALPGYAGIFLTIAQDITHVAEVATAAAEPLLKFGLAAHGALVYVGLAATGGAALMTNMLTGMSGLALNAATRLEGLGAAGAVASRDCSRWAGRRKRRRRCPGGGFSPLPQGSACSSTTWPRRRTPHSSSTSRCRTPSGVRRWGT